MAEQLMQATNEYPPHTPPLSTDVVFISVVYLLRFFIVRHVPRFP